MKKLATILALTGVVANLGLATVFAQSTGSQTISCNFNGAATITKPSLGFGDTVTFESRTTSFYNDASDAPLTTNLPVEVTDTRGYDAGPNDCRPPVQAADSPFQLQIQSPGLTLGSTTLALQLGTALTNADLSGTGSPTLVTDVAQASGTTGLITSAVNLINFDETFSGTVSATLSGDDLQVERPTGPIPPGLYSGAITLSLNNL